MMTDTASGGEAPERDHDQVGDREQKAEEHRDARALEIVGDDDLNRKAARRVACFGYFGHRPSVAVAAVGRGAVVRLRSRDARGERHPRRCAAAPQASIRGAVHRTPTFTSRSLGPGRYLKAELFQRTGSFKARGALNRIRALSPDEREAGRDQRLGRESRPGAGVGGRHRETSMRCSSCGRARAPRRSMPPAATAPRSTWRRPGRARRSSGCDELREQTGRTFVHPFDDPVVIAGAGTVGLEILEDVPDVDTIVVACGGGGLVSGIAAACVPAGVRVVAVEPERSNALALGLAAGEPVPVTPETIADALTAPFTGGVPIEICGALGVDVVLVSEDEIREAFRFLYSRAKLAAEPGAAVATAAVLAGKVEGETLVSVVSGGNVSTDIASAILAAP